MATRSARAAIERRQLRQTAVATKDSSGAQLVQAASSIQPTTTLPPTPNGKLWAAYKANKS